MVEFSIAFSVIDYQKQLDNSTTQLDVEMYDKLKQICELNVELNMQNKKTDAANQLVELGSDRKYRDRHLVDIDQKCLGPISDDNNPLLVLDSASKQNLNLEHSILGVEKALNDKFTNLNLAYEQLKIRCQNENDKLSAALSIVETQLEEKSDLHRRQVAIAEEVSARERAAEAKATELSIQLLASVGQAAAFEKLWRAEKKNCAEKKSRANEAALANLTLKLLVHHYKEKERAQVSC